MGEQDILARIDEMIAEEHELRNGAGDRANPADTSARLAELEQSLDRCWDLLRQREARRAAGQDPGAARPRSIAEVESYLQ